MAAANKHTTSFAKSLNKITRYHYLYLLAYAISIIVFDSWNLITHESVINFWTAVGVMLILNTILWYSSRLNYRNPRIYQGGIVALVLADIVFAGLTIYWERGIASSSVILFTIPIVSAIGLRRRSALFAAAILSASVYSIAAVRYFYSHYGESYRVELYGEIFFYSVMFLVIAGLLASLTRPSSN